jgi:hypothetical protein
MKPASVKSRILGRLVSVLLVPVILSSSITTVYVSADDEVDVVENDAVLDAQVDEQIDDTQDTTIEDVNDDSDDSAANDVVDGEDEVVADAPSDDATDTTSDDGAIEITAEDEENEDELLEEETDEESDDDKTEANNETKLETVLVDVNIEGCPEEALAVFADDMKLSAGAQELTFSFDLPEDQDTDDVETDDSKEQEPEVEELVTFSYTVAEDYKDSYEIVSASVNELGFDGATEYSINDASEILFSIKTQSLDHNAPEFGKETAPSDAGSYDKDDHKFYYSQDASDLVVSVPVTDKKDGHESKVNPDSVYVTLSDGGMQKMSRDGETDTYTWTPSECGNYVVTGFVAEDNSGNAGSITLDEAIEICYYNLKQDVASINVNNPNTKWVNKANNIGELHVSGTTIAPLDTITLSGNDKTITKEISSENNAFDVNIEFPKLQGEKKYTLTYKFKTGDEAEYKGDITLKFDDKAPSNEVVEGKVVNSGEYGSENIAEIVIPSEGGIEDASPISYAIVSVEAKITSLVRRGWIIRRDKYVTETVQQTYMVPVLEEKAGVTITGKNELVYNISFDIDYVNKQPNATVCEEQYKITDIVVYDEAGNYVSTTINDDGSSRDIGSPRIYYILNDEFLDGYIEREEDQGIEYFNKNPKIQVLLVDSTLKTSTIEFSDYGDHDAETSINTLIENNTTVDRDPEDGEYAKDVLYTIDPAVNEAERLISFRTSASDKFGKDSNIVIPKKIAVDTLDPRIAVTYNGKDAPEKYNGTDVTVRVNITERWLDTTTSYVRIVGTDEDGNAVTFSTEDGTLTWEGSDSDNYVEWTSAVDGVYHVEYYAIDRATNDTEEITGPEFFVDKKVPEIDVKYNEVEPKNGKYYNATRIATITVTDFTFDPAASDVKISSEYGNAHKSEWSNDGTKVHVMTVTFDEDGYYSFSVVAKDMVDHTTTRDEAEFVVDKTAPGISVSYDYNEPRNGMYYKTARTATVDIEDISFNSDLVKVSSQSLAEQAELPQLGGFTSDGKSNYAHMSFAYDGTYGYVINCEDLAGNTASAYTSDVFVIDTTAPEVKFAGVENYSANNGVVAPSVSYVDKYMDMEATTVTMTGSNNGAVAVGSQVAPAENGFVVSYADFEHVKSMDDLYILEANVVDLAGNETKEQLVFSVNRFGSVFVLSDAAKVLNEEYYTSNPTDVAITEINVDELTYRNVSISRDGDIKELKNGKQYKVTKQGSDTTWKTYTYTISKDNFEKDGIYSVTVYSKDRATNVQDNKSRDAEINFAVDRTAPSIVTAGLEEAGVYKETSHVVNIDVTDNMGVTSLTVYKDDQEIESYDAEALESAGGVESITLDESEKRQTIKLVAEDVAGNVETVVYGNILVSTKEEVAPPVTEEVANGEGDLPEIRGATRPINVAVYIVLALGIVAAGAGAGVLVYRKKTSNSEK